MLRKGCAIGFGYRRALGFLIMPSKVARFSYCLRRLMDIAIVTPKFVLQRRARRCTLCTPEGRSVARFPYFLTMMPSSATTIITMMMSMKNIASRPWLPRSLLLALFALMHACFFLSDKAVAAFVYCVSLQCFCFLVNAVFAFL